MFNKTRSIAFIFAQLISLCARAALEVQPVQFEKEILDNGLRVIYAPMHEAPVVHVRVLYHVGSRDERPDRQGFAHMFEHMMFRGSAHVPPEQHMKMINVVGGNSNAFTSFDQTTYINTIPANAVEMALYLEADRMASFKVNDAIFQTERKVVAEEWRMRVANPPLGTLDQDFFKTAYSAHSYRWTPIGDMDQLRAARSSELQEFFNKYYIPNNACLIIAGDIDVAKTRLWVKQYFGWIPKGAAITREVLAEPEQTQPRELLVYKPNVPLTNIYMGFKTTDYRSDDHYALLLLGDILSHGRTGRLDRKFVNGQDPSCVRVGAGDEQLEDQSFFGITAVIQPGKEPEQVQKDLLAAVYEVAEKGVTADELEKVRTQIKVSLIRTRGGLDYPNSPCTAIATELGDEEVFGGDAQRVNKFLPKLDAVTPAAIQQVARKYLMPARLTVVEYRPDPTGINARKAATMAAVAEATKNAPVVPSSSAIEPRVVQFPPGYPTQPPFNSTTVQASFNKGVEETVAGIKVITLTDHHLPLVNISLIMPGGGDGEASSKTGLANMTAQMLRRGSAGIGFLDFSADLESRGISIDASDAADNTRISIACTSEQLDYAISKANQVLTQPNFSADELDKLKRQSIASLTQSLSNPETAAAREMKQILWEGGTLARVTTVKSLDAIGVDDLRQWHEKFYQLQGAFMMISGDVSPEQGKQLAQKLIGGLERRKAPPPVNYGMWSMLPGRRIILVDNPEGKQATIRLATRAYDIHNDVKFAGTLAGSIMSSGIEGRLMKYARAEKGLAYGCRAYFQPGRHVGDFSGAVDTNPETAADAIEAMIKVFNDMKAAEVAPAELTEAKTRTVGSMVMEMQTMAQQAGRRAEQIINEYPIDYWDRYPQRLSEVSGEQVKKVMSDFANDQRLVIVVVAPASVVKSQLERVGDVEVIPMPLNRQN